MITAILLLSISMFLTYLSWALLWRKGKNEHENLFMEREAERCLNGNCEIDEEWRPINGRLFTYGFCVVKDKNGRKRFIKQAKLADLGLLFV